MHTIECILDSHVACLYIIEKVSSLRSPCIVCAFKHASISLSRSLPVHSRKQYACSSRSLEIEDQRPLMSRLVSEDSLGLAGQSTHPSRCWGAHIANATPVDMPILLLSKCGASSFGGEHVGDEIVGSVFRIRCTSCSPGMITIPA